VPLILPPMAVVTFKLSAASISRREQHAGADV
jgi:hypothetical protein